MDLKLEFDKATINIEGADASVVQTALLGFYAMHGVQLSPEVEPTVGKPATNQKEEPASELQKAYANALASQVPKEVQPVVAVSKTTPPTIAETTRPAELPKAVQSKTASSVQQRSKQLPLVSSTKDAETVWSSNDDVSVRKHTPTATPFTLTQNHVDTPGTIIGGLEVVAPGVRKSPEGPLTYRTQYKCPSCQHEGFRFARSTNDYVKCHECDTKITIKPILGRLDASGIPVPTEDGVYYKAITFDRP